MPDKPKDPPSYEDIVRDWGHDKMAFFCDMVRPDQHEEREEDANFPTGASLNQDSSQDLTPQEERELIKNIEARSGRKLSQQEINLALEQARSI